MKEDNACEQHDCQQGQGREPGFFALHPRRLRDSTGGVKKRRGDKGARAARPRDRVQVLAGTPKSENRGPKEIRSRSPNVSVPNIVHAAFYLPDIEGDFGLRISGFFRDSGIRISEFQISRYFCAIGTRRPTPNALLVTFNPGAA